ncbi:MAG: hypothetical protein AAB434_02845 [Planctomycetota bacterium]
MGSVKQVLTGLLLLAALAGLAVVAMENRSLQERVAALEKGASTRTAAPVASPSSAPAQVVTLPDGGNARLEERIAEIEKRTGGSTGPLPVSTTAVGDVLPASTTEEGAAEETPPVTEAFKKAVLSVLKERDDKQKERDAERSKAWQEGMVERQINDLTERLQLTETQRQQIDAIFKEGMDRAMKAWAPLMGNTNTDQKIDRAAIMAETEKLTAEIDGKAKTLLTSEQSVKYDDWRKEQNQWMRMMGGGGVRRR